LLFTASDDDDDAGTSRCWHHVQRRSSRSTLSRVVTPVGSQQPTCIFTLRTCSAKTEDRIDPRMMTVNPGFASSSFRVVSSIAIITEPLAADQPQSFSTSSTVLLHRRLFTLQHFLVVSLSLSLSLVSTSKGHLLLWLATSAMLSVLARDVVGGAIDDGATAKDVC